MSVWLALSVPAAFARTSNPDCQPGACIADDPAFKHYDRVERIRYGYGMTANHAAAFYWYAKSAKAGDSRAMLNTALMLLRGMGTETNESDAVVWLWKALDHGQPAAAIELGHRHRLALHGQDGAQQAFRYYDYAAKRGDVRGQHALANLYVAGKGVEQSLAEAFVLYALAARKGHVPSLRAKARLVEWMTLSQRRRASELLAERLSIP